MKRCPVFMSHQVHTSNRNTHLDLYGTLKSRTDRGGARHGEQTTVVPYELALPAAGAVRECQPWGNHKRKLSRILWPQSRIVGRNYPKPQERPEANRNLHIQKSQLTGQTKHNRIATWNSFASRRNAPSSHFLSLFSRCLSPLSELLSTTILFSMNRVQALEPRPMSPRSRRI